MIQYSTTVKTTKAYLALCLCCILLLWNTSTALAQEGKNIRGQVIDKDSKSPISNVNVVVVNSDPFIGTVTDDKGYFTLPNVPLGRATIKFSYIGYRDAFSNDILIIAGKETQINIELEEKINEIKEVVISDKSEKGKAKNEFAAVSARSFEVEQTNRFSGSRNDPARMASNFAGVSGANDARNDIIIRGNSPTGLLWRLEGVDIPSPNHFSSFGSTGGPVSMLNNNTLARSDFMTSAFPAEYGNAVAGVFDLKMRSGNKDKYEFLAQVGFNGFELGAEGPFAKKKSQATFLINYRYSTLGVFKAFGVNFGTGTAVPEYQDLTIKIDVPTKKAGIFRFFTLAGLSSIDLLGSKTDTTKKSTNLFGNANQDIYNRVRMGVVGLSHTYFVSPKSFTKFILSASYQWNGVDIDTVSLVDRKYTSRYDKISFRQNKYAAHFLYNHKFNSKNTLVSGVIGDVYHINFSDSLAHVIDTTGKQGFIPLRTGSGVSALIQVYTSWLHRFTDRLSLTAGLHLQYHTLSKSLTIPEPRLGLKYQLKEGQYISIGYGLHSQLQPVPTYYNVDTSKTLGTSTNANMGFTRSNHFVVGYDLTFHKDFHFKTEAYFQYVDRAAVDSFASSFSMLNAGADFATPSNANLVNKGTGRNYGLEFTFEKFLSHGYYFLATASIFQSQYRGSDSIWRNTAFNGNYVINGLGGYEFKFSGKKSKTKRNAIAIDVKATLAGGRYYTPVDVAASQAARGTVYDVAHAFSEQYPLYYRFDAKLSFRHSFKKTTMEFSIDMQNFTNRKNVFRYSYDARTNTKTQEFQQGLFPVPQFKLFF
jgi:CarboxypepD_reg-like domain